MVAISWVYITLSFSNGNCRLSRILLKGPTRLTWKSIISVCTVDMLDIDLSKLKFRQKYNIWVWKNLTGFFHMLPEKWIPHTRAVEIFRNCRLHALRLVYKWVGIVYRHMYGHHPLCRSHWKIIKICLRWYAMRTYHNICNLVLTHHYQNKFCINQLTGRKLEISHR